MTEITLQQANYRREDGGRVQLLGRSSEFADEWLPLVEALIVGFGERAPGVCCDGAIFARPLGRHHVAVVQVADRAEDLDRPAALAFHVLVLPRNIYEALTGDPFALADRFPPAWGTAGTLPALTMPAEPLPPRSVEDVQRVLKRVKAHALQEGEDPYAHGPVDVKDAESPALLGGVQALVDGGRVVFERPGPDPGLIRGLWTLLPSRSRCDLWPASFAYGNALGFDALVVPKAEGAAFSGYTGEDAAAEYPQGNYELSLQIAAESGDQKALNALLNRRSWKDTWRLGLTILAAAAAIVLILKLTAPAPPPSPERLEKVATAATVVSVRDPFVALGLLDIGNKKWAGKGQEGR